MGNPVSWFTPLAMQALGWALVHFLWQGAALAALASALMHFSDRPSTRYTTLVAMLALMLAIPVATFILYYNFAISLLPWVAARPALIVSALPRQILPWLVETWLVGLALFGLRFAGGWLLLQQRQRRQCHAACAELLLLCESVQQRLGLTRTIRYLECGWLQVPAVIGCIRPIVLLPVTAFTGFTELQLRAVIAHELAHIRRWDFLVNLFQILAETLLFYHPAIWWLSRRIRSEREVCCDEFAVAEAGEPLAYARALTLMAKGANTPTIALAATDGSLSERIWRILGQPPVKPHVTRLGASLLFFLASMAAGNALLVLAAPLAARHDHANTHYMASLDRNKGESRLASLAVSDAVPATTVPRDDHEYVIPRRNWRDSIRTVKPLPLTPTPALIQIASANLASLDDQHLAPGPRADVSPATIPVPAPLPVQVASVAAKDLEALTVADDEYPAPSLKLQGPFGWHEGPWAVAQNYCKEFAAQTVTQGANRPIAVDDGVKQRLAFFYWHCMFNNGQMDGNMYFTAPAYLAVGPASSNNPVNVAGSWTVSVHAQPPRSCSLTQSGNSLAGTCTRYGASSAVTGVIDGHQVRLAWKYALNDELDFIGMVEPDGTMTGQCLVFANTAESDGDRFAMFTARPGGFRSHPRIKIQ